MSGEKIIILIFEQNFGSWSEFCRKIPENVINFRTYYLGLFSSTCKKCTVVSPDPVAGASIAVIVFEFLDDKISMSQLFVKNLVGKLQNMLVTAASRNYAKL